MMVFANRSQKHVANHSQVRCNTRDVSMVLLAWFAGTPDHRGPDYRDLIAPGKAQKKQENTWGDAIS